MQLVANEVPNQSLGRLKGTIHHCVLVFLGFSLLYLAFFAPILASPYLLAPGDGLLYYAPAFYAPQTLWSDMLSGGYPIAADPQNMSWYLPAMLLRWIPGGWNAFVVLAYVLAGSFAYCYTYTVTTSILAAIVAGVVYSMSGFIMSHLGHTTIIHAVAWTPLFVCALERLRRGFSPFWWIVGAGALACCFLAGHPQEFFYTAGLGFFYALCLGGTARSGRWRYYAVVAALMAIGLGLCGIQILPTAELGKLSQRSAMTFGDFISFSFPKKQTLQLFFPFLFGSGYEPPYQLYVTPYWGKWSLTEITGYVGLLPISLAAIGWAARRSAPKGVTQFWLGFGLITLVLAFGGDIFLGRLFYYVPIYNKFRAPARHFFEVALAIAVLSGFGIAAVQRRQVTNRLVGRVIGLTAAGMGCALLSLIWFEPTWRSMAATVGVTNLSLAPWKNPAVGVPVMLFVAGILALGLWTRWRAARWSRLLLIAVLVCDMGSFGWFWEWRNYSPLAQRLERTALAAEYRDELNRTHERLLSDTENTFTNPEVLFPNATRLWEVPNASGYSPLLLSRVADLMQISSNGSLIRYPKGANDRSLDLMAVKYLLLNQDMTQPIAGQADPWSPLDLSVAVGSACGPEPFASQATIDFGSQPRLASELGLVSSLGCGTEFPDQMAVAEMIVTDEQGRSTPYPIRAGRDTAEITYDCPPTKSQVKHSRPLVFRDFPAEQCQAHQYLAKVTLPKSQRIQKIAFQWKQPVGVLQLSRINLVDRATQVVTPVLPTDFAPQWQRAATQTDGVLKLVNQQVLPRTWLVSETVTLKPEQILATIRTSQLPDGRRYEPQQMALIEDSQGALQGRLKSAALGNADRAEILKLESMQVKIKTQSAHPTFLVLSDVNYPGWKVTIDGKPTKIYQTNYVQRGVSLPAGEHLVEYRFDPTSLKLGAGLTGLSGIALGYVALVGQRRSRAQSSTEWIQQSP
ncbi:MAG: hypothetical protein RLZZ511_2925 [Cyanobacteriota bacterium]|jgi:hypothetical protein